ncbi:hypothetical protein TL16_g07950 [Triparma laevis f. inornata]|uniref:Uncharacterized protein n=1 Tax=Triparma laevis f. inornata TaxID=1714386 RepID=A0A9W7B0G5_9STRA|nr:hypothetical protein TL16_g07950 [Triparma laevis f. inornata]
MLLSFGTTKPKIKPKIVPETHTTASNQFPPFPIRHGPLLPSSDSSLPLSPQNPPTDQPINQTNLSKLQKVGTRFLHTKYGPGIVKKVKGKSWCVGSFVGKEITFQGTKLIQSIEGVNLKTNVMVTTHVAGTFPDISDEEIKSGDSEYADPATLGLPATWRVRKALRGSSRCRYIIQAIPSKKVFETKQAAQAYLERIDVGVDGKEKQTKRKSLRDRWFLRNLRRRRLRLAYVDPKAANSNFPPLASKKMILNKKENTHTQSYKRYLIEAYPSKKVFENIRLALEYLDRIEVGVDGKEVRSFLDRGQPHKCARLFSKAFDIDALFKKGVIIQKKTLEFGLPPSWRIGEKPPPGLMKYYVSPDGYMFDSNKNVFSFLSETRAAVSTAHEPLTPEEISVGCEYISPTTLRFPPAWVVKLIIVEKRLDKPRYCIEARPSGKYFGSIKDANAYLKNLNVGVDGKEEPHKCVELFAEKTFNFDLMIRRNAIENMDPIKYNLSEDWRKKMGNIVTFFVSPCECQFDREDKAKLFIVQNDPTSPTTDPAADSARNDHKKTKNVKKPSYSIPRPPGRPPKDKDWDGEQGKWVESNCQTNPPSSSQQKSLPAVDVEEDADIEYVDPAVMRVPRTWLVKLTGTVQYYIEARAELPRRCSVLVQISLRG